MENGSPDWIRRVLSIPIDRDGAMKLDEALAIVGLAEGGQPSRLATLRLARHVHPDKNSGSTEARVASTRVTQAMHVCDDRGRYA